MTKPRILVTGASGGTGRPVVEQLLAAGFPVRAMVRGRDARSAELQRLGAEVVVADFYDVDQMLAALTGVQRAYFVPVFEPFMIQSAAAFAWAAQRAGIEHIVQMSQWTSHRAHPAAMTQQTWLVDHLFAHLPGVAHTILNPGMFAHNFLRVIDFAALLGVYPVLSGDGRAAPVSNEDIGRVAAALLAQGPSRHAGRRYRPTGPALLNGHDMSQIVARAVGHAVVPIPMPFWLLGKVARQQGVDPYQVACLRHYMEDMKQGAFAFEGGVTSVVQDLTGAPAESFLTTAHRYAALPFARQTLGRRLMAALKFMAVPWVPGYDFERYERQLRLPRAARSSLSIEDAAWQDEHRVQMGAGAATLADPARWPAARVA